MKHIPHTVDELIDTLDVENPPRCITRNQTLEDAHRYAGRRELIDQLIELRARGTEGLPNVL